MRAEDIFGPPMAAPETRAMSLLRFAFIAVATCTGIGIIAIAALVALFGRVATGGVLLALIVVAAVLGFAYFRTKMRRDDRWLLTRGFDREGEGA